MNKKYDADAFQDLTVQLSFGGADIEMLCALGLAGEVGEVIEPIKKSRIHGRDFDKAAMLLELGDVLWYLARLAKYYGFTMSEVMAANEAKLAKRHGNTFKQGVAS